MANYNYIVDASFQPFSMQEMLVPFTAYKEAFEKSEDAYDKLSEADDFKYLSKTLPEGSAARALYEGYANDLHSQAEDLAQNGLTMGNRRALTSLKRRYRGEIGQLVKADEALKEEKKLRQTLNAQDPERLYATDNLSIDDFLEGKNPNLYSISGKDLYARGAQAAKAYSSRLFNTGEGPKTLGGYYIDWIQRNGTSPESIAAFRENMKSIPEMYNAYKSILKETGVDKNLSGYSLERAEASVLNGMTDGFVYQEIHNPQRNLGVMTAAEQANYNLEVEKVQAAKKAAKAKLNAQGEKNDRTVLKKGVRISWKGNNPKDTNGEADGDYDINDIEDSDTSHIGAPTSFDALPTYAKDRVRRIIGATGSPDDYTIYYLPYKDGGLWNDVEASVEIIPKDIKRLRNSANSSNFGENTVE